MHREETFSLAIPSGWTARRDQERVYFVSTDPPGVLCCTAQRVQAAEELPNLSRMLAGFLTRSGHSVAPNELLHISSVPGATGFCWQYIEDDTFHRLWIFGNQASWLLWTFTSASADMEHFYPSLEAMLKSLTVAEYEGDR